MRSPLLRAIVGVTQLHVAGEYPNDAFVVAGQHLADQLYNVLIGDEAGVHFAAAVLFQANATELQRHPGTVRAAVASAALACVGELMNLARREAPNLPDCTAAGREILAKQRQTHAPEETSPPPTTYACDFCRDGHRFMTTVDAVNADGSVENPRPAPCLVCSRTQPAPLTADPTPPQSESSSP